MKVFRAPRAVLAEVDRILATTRPSFRGVTPLEQVVDALARDRHYFWIGIYLVAGRRAVRQAFRGPVPPCHTFEFGKGNVGTTGESGVTKVVDDVTDDPTYSMCFTETKSEIVIPIKMGMRVLGVIDVESDRRSAFGSEERILLEGVAHRLAKYLATDGRYLVRRATEKSEAKAAARAAAGDTQPR